MTVLGLVGDPPPRVRRRLLAQWPGRVVDRPSAGDGRSDAVLVWDDETGRVLDVIATQPTGRRWWLHTRSAGVDQEVLGALAGRDVVYTKGSGAHATAVAEHVMAVLLALCKRVPDLVTAAESRRWAVPDGIREVSGSTVTVLGFGAIGRATARLLSAFGATVIGVRRSTGTYLGDIEVVPVDRLDDALRRSSVLVVAAPLTPATRALVGTNRLATLAAGSLLVNVGRGPVVDQDALVSTLRSGQLAGAALDVFDREPLPPESPLWRAPNLIVSPHCADATPATDDRALHAFLANARRWLAGDPLHGVVDPWHGY